MLRPFFVFSLILFGAFSFSLAQGDEAAPAETPPTVPNPGAYCNVFYVKSFDTTALPFQDVCFVVNEYRIFTARYFKCIGPIEGSIDLFRKYPWAMHFNMPYVVEGDRLSVQVPEEVDAYGLDMSPGNFYLTVSDYQNRAEAEKGPEKAAFGSVKGKATITDYTPMSGDMRFPEYTAQLDLTMRKVTYQGEKAAFTGRPFRLRMVLRVEALR